MFSNRKLKCLTCCVLLAKPAAPPAPFQPGPPPPPANVTSSSGFKFGTINTPFYIHDTYNDALHYNLDSNTNPFAGFGNRFVKPKGPRSYPEPWI